MKAKKKVSKPGRQWARLPESIKTQVSRTDVVGVTFMRAFHTIHVDKKDGTRATFVEMANGMWKIDKAE